MEKNCVLNHPLTHSPSLFDTQITEALALRNKQVTTPKQTAAVLLVDG